MKKSLGRCVTFHDTSTPAMKMIAFSSTSGAVMPESPSVYLIPSAGSHS